MEISAFIATPYTEESRRLYEEVLRPSLEAFGIVAKRADDIVFGGRISDKISELISGSEIVICDISVANANVFFEIGLARAQNKNLIVLADENALRFPSDFDGMQTIRYNSDNDGWQQQLEQSLRKVLLAGGYSNRVFEFNEEASLEIYIKYRNLTLRELTDFLHNIESVHQALMSVTSPVFYLPDSEQAFQNSLIINRAYTGNSVNFSFKEGWLPQFNLDGQDVNIGVPKNLGIPALVGIALLSSANQVLDVKNKYLDSQIKEIELKSKEIEYMQKLKEKPSKAITSRANKTIRQLNQSQNIVNVEINNIQVIGKN